MYKDDDENVKTIDGTLPLRDLSTFRVLLSVFLMWIWVEFELRRREDRWYSIVRLAVCSF